MGVSGAQKREKRGRSAVPESKPGKTPPQPAAAIAHIYRKPRLYASQPTQAVGPGQRTARGEGSSSLGQAFLRARPLRPKDRSRRLSLRIPRPLVAPESSVNSRCGGRSRWSAGAPPTAFWGFGTTSPTDETFIQTDRGSPNGAGYPDRRGQHPQVRLDRRLISISPQEYCQ